ncbi:PASTA domain protein [Hoylesella marshii DSM 16973 = JCM 13450]|uniref:PASTA domain protein n=2 Tax=Hoylesella marshii TaxID=189722 RepID=E0NUK1_9BACT|nr:PASTA domain protein [Hoylesella marshii DSM 16973 = JCM 13450]
MKELRKYSQDTQKQTGMKSSEFVGKFKSKYLWGNILAMIGVVLLLGVGAKYGLDLYTHHGEAIAVPALRSKSFADAKKILETMGLEIVVSDTGYVKTLPPDCILEQSPIAGQKVKSGHIIYVTVNALNSPTLTLPDLIDNSSLREAQAKLTAMGFRLGNPQYVAGEKDWVYGIICKGKHLNAGDRVSVEDLLVIQVGNGVRDDADSVDIVDPIFEDNHGTEQPDNSDVDEFEVVTGPETPGKKG